MNAEPTKVLLVEDNPSDARLIREMLFEERGDSASVVRQTFALECVERLSAGLARLSSGDIDVVLLDLSLPDSHGLGTFSKMHAEVPQVPIILLTGLDDEELGVTAVREGAQDYLVKGQVDDNLLVRAIHYAIERKRVGKALLLAAQHWQDTFDAIGDLVAILDRDHRVVRANQAMHEAFGGKEVLGVPCYGLFHGTERCILDCPVEKTFRSGKAAQTELREEHLGDRWLQIFSYPIKSEDGTVENVVHIARDTTEQRRTEERIQQHERLMAVGQLGAGIAHDFNNLLTGIMGYAELALDDLEPDSRAYQYITIIPKLGNRGANLIKQLLTFSRQTPTERRPMNLLPLVKEIVKMLQHTLPEHIVIRVVSPDRVATINGDPTQMQQVITNLCVNAAHAMPNGGELTLSVTDVTLDEEYCRHHTDVSPGNYVNLSVRDTGVGMTPEVQGHIFEPFFTTKEVGGGTGLGLAVVYGIIETHEGHIGVYSEEGKGTEFTVYLPTLDVGEAREDVSGEERLPGGTETLLFVEDESMVLGAGQMMLESLGYTVLAARNGEEALEIYLPRWDEIALVLTDMVMPKMGGGELYEALLRINPGVKVVLVSGYNIKASNSDLQALGFKGFVQKPFRRNGLARKIREVLDE